MILKDLQEGTLFRRDSGLWTEDYYGAISLIFVRQRGRKEKKKRHSAVALSSQTEIDPLAVASAE